MSEYGGMILFAAACSALFGLMAVLQLKKILQVLEKIQTKISATHADAVPVSCMNDEIGPEILAAISAVMHQELGANMAITNIRKI